MEVEYVPRPEYGLVLPLLDAVDGGLRRDRRRRRPRPVVPGAAGRRRVVRLGPVPPACRASRSASRCITTSAPTPGTARVWSESEIAARLDDTVAAWQSWSELHQAYVGPWRDLVHHSGRVLQALSFQPTGAICAAATTSLPEVVGGARNWDYRYAWVRDASFTIEALWVAACPDEANEFFDYMTASAAGSLEHGGDLQIMFGIGGERDLTERELPHLPGWRQSAPVRVGNGAWRQRQLDVYGELLSAAHRLSDRLFDRGTGRARPTVDAPEHRDRVPRRAGRHRRAALAGEGPGHLGGPRRAAPLRLLQADVLGGARPGDRARRPARRRATASTAWTRDPGRDPRGHPARRLERPGQRVHPVLRLRRPRRVQPDAAARRVPPRRRPAGCWPRSTPPRSGSPTSAAWSTATGPHDGLDGEEGTFLLCTFWLAQALAHGRPDRPGARRVRTSRGVRQRRRPARRRGRPDERRAAGQLPPGVQPHRPGQRGVGDLRGRGARRRHERGLTARRAAGRRRCRRSRR